MNFFARYFFVFLSVFWIGKLFSQETSQLVPPSFNRHGISMNIPNVSLPQLDVDIFLAEDQESVKMGNPMRIGIFQPINYTMNNSGRLDVLPDGSRMWRLKLTSPEALAMNLRLLQLNIPDGAELYLYNSFDDKIVWQYDQENIIDYMIGGEEFLSQEIPGDEIIIEYFEPADVSFKGSFTISDVGHLYRGDFITQKGNHGDAEGTCHPDVTCPEGEGWEDQINSAVFIMQTTQSGIYYCSGAVINNVRQDKTPYVLTAAHCDVGSGSFRFYFNYQAHTCKSNVGSSGNSVSGGEILARGSYGSSSDFMLLKITGNLSAVVRSKLYFSGWNANNTVPTVGACIHHPGGDFKKISIPQKVSSTSSMPRYWEVKWRTGINNIGVTEQGSSGSPLFDKDKRIVGQLYGGTSYCYYPEGDDFYGKLAYSWTNNNTSNNALKLNPWLDPDNTGKMFMNGIYYNDSIGTGIAETISFKTKINIHPNPASGLITIKGDFGNKTVQCNVFNLLGELLYSKELPASPEIILNLDYLSDGMYIIEMRDDLKVQTAKLLISK